MARRVLTGEKLEKELERLSLMREFERQYEDCAFICGIDEAGRGPLAGPVAAGADHQGRREERFYRGSQHPRKGDQGPYDGGVR